MTLTTGAILQNRYRIVKLVAQGGFGAVYRAWDLSLEQPVAVKESFGTGPEAQRQFEREAKLLAGLRHANLPRVGDHFIVPGQGQYLVMDFVEGKSLADRLAERGRPLAEAETLPWIRQVCDALTYLHTRTPPIIHRDIKPENIIVTAEGRAILVDFGISKTYDPSKGTTVGAKAVTPGYSPPEQYGRGRTDARSDVYSLGATLYTLLTGQTPPEAPDLSSGADVLEPPRALNPAVSEETSRAVVAAMSLSMGQRVGDAGAFERLLAGGVAPRGSVAPVGRRRKTPIWAWLVGGAALVALAVWAAITFGGWDVAGMVGQETVTVVALVADTAGETTTPTVLAVADVAPTVSPIAVSTAGPTTASPTQPPTTAPSVTPTAPTTTATPETAVGDRQLTEPVGIAVDADGNLYVAEAINHRIQKFAADGTWLSTLGSQGNQPGQFNSPRDIALDTEGNLYIADAGNARIQKFTADGTFLDMWDSGQGPFSHMWSLAVDSAGNIYVADTYNYRIQKLAADGTFLDAWGSQGREPGQFNFPQGIAVDGDGNVYVADGVNYRIQKFASDGRFLDIWDSDSIEEDLFLQPGGVTVAANGHVYVTDTRNHSIRQFAPDGTLLATWGSIGWGQGEFNSPRGIAHDTAGNIYVADTQNDRIQKFTADGEFLAVWGGEN